MGTHHLPFFSGSHLVSLPHPLLSDLHPPFQGLLGRRFSEGPREREEGSEVPAVRVLGSVPPQPPHQWAMNLPCPELP